MAKLMVIYKTPQDRAHFDSYYIQTHVPLAKKIPGLTRYEISDGAVNSPAGDSGVHLVAILTFENMEAVGRGFASPEGKVAAADVGKFATGGADMLIFDTKEV